MNRLDYMHASRFAAELGISDGVLEGWIKRHWRSRVQYVVIGHQTLIHIERANEWISEHGQLASDQQNEDPASQSGFGNMGSSRTTRRSAATPMYRVTCQPR